MRSESLHPLLDVESAPPRTRFLVEVTEALIAATGYEETLRQLVACSVPVLGDWALVSMVDPASGVPAVAALDHHHENLREFAWSVLRTRPWAGDGENPGFARGGEDSLLVPELSEDAIRGLARDGRQAEQLHRVGFSSFLRAPLVARGRTVGLIEFGRGDGEPRFNSSDATLAEALGRRAGALVDNARLHAAEQEARQRAEASA